MAHTSEPPSEDLPAPSSASSPGLAPVMPPKPVAVAAAKPGAARYGMAAALMMMVGGLLVVVILGTTVARGKRADSTEPTDPATASDATAATAAPTAAAPAPRAVPEISSLALEPLRVKYIVPPSWRRESPKFVNTFKEAIKPYEAGDYATSIQRMRDLSALFPKRPEPFVYGGVSHLMLGHTAEAIELLNRAAPLTREAFAEDILWYLALARRAEGRSDAVMELRRICAIGADHGPKACAAVRDIDARAQGSR